MKPYGGIFMNRKRFTLIELLVVIAIIAILAAMLLPALSSARATAQSSVCLSKIKQINVWGDLYCADNEEFYWPAWLEYKNGSYYYWGLNPGNPFSKAGFWENQSVDGSKSLAYITGGPLDCPSNENVFPGYEVNARAWNYGMNFHLNSDSTQGGGYYDPCLPRSKATDPGKLSTFADCGSGFARFSSTKRGAANSNGNWDGSGNAATRPQYTIWWGHANHANVGFSDGHAEPMTKTTFSESNIFIVLK